MTRIATIGQDGFEVAVEVNAALDRAGLSRKQEPCQSGQQGAHRKRREPMTSWKPFEWELHDVLSRFRFKLSAERAKLFR